jgi:hypothetical protein
MQIWLHHGLETAMLSGTERSWRRNELPLHDDDSKQKQQFLVDTSAVMSVLLYCSPSPPSGCPFQRLTGRTFPPTRSRSKTILNLDFLSTHKLLVDPVSRQVLDAKSPKPLSKQLANRFPCRFAATLCSIIYGL